MQRRHLGADPERVAGAVATISTRPLVDDSEERSEDRGAGRWPGWPVLLAVLGMGVAVGAAVLVWLAWPRPPGEGSAEVGFSRDMAEHHRQAVEMALIVRDRTQDPEVFSLATDIVLTQQAQVGTMQGWLLAWDVAETGRDPRMAWMGHPTEGRMPGMASAEDIQRLRDLPPAEADGLFLELMLRHHVGGVAMAEAALERAERSEVRFLAEKTVAAQDAEIALMQTMRQARGLPPVDLANPAEDGEHGHEEG